MMENNTADSTSHEYIILKRMIEQRLRHYSMVQQETRLSDAELDQAYELLINKGWIKGMGDFHFERYSPTTAGISAYLKEPDILQDPVTYHQFQIIQAMLENGIVDYQMIQHTLGLTETEMETAYTRLIEKAWILPGGVLKKGYGVPTTAGMDFYREKKVKGWGE